MRAKNDKRLVIVLSLIQNTLKPFVCIPCLNAAIWAQKRIPSTGHDLISHMTSVTYTLST